MKQVKLFHDDKLDPEIAKAADRYVELIDEKRATKERLEISVKNLIGLMNKIGKTKVTHQGHIIEIKHVAEKETLKLKKVSEKKAKRKKN